MTDLPSPTRRPSRRRSPPPAQTRRAGSVPAPRAGERHPGPKALLSIFLAMAAPAGPAAGQGRGAGPALIPGEDRPVSLDEPGLTHVEPHLAVDPRDPARMVAASIVFRDGRMTSETLVSTDGGTSWARTTFPRCAGDPWVAWGSGANVYFSCLGADGGPVRALVHRSTEGGRSWSREVEVPRGGGASFDHTSLAVHRRADRADVVWIAGMQGLRPEDEPPLSAPFLAVSLDGGRSFEHVGRVVWSDVMANALNPVVLDAETAGLPFVDFSVDGRSRIDHPRIWWVRAGPGPGFSLPHRVASASGTRILPTIAAGPPRGDSTALYLAYDDLRGGRQGIFLVRSGDGGRTWSEPAAVVAGEPSVVEHQNPVTATDPSGNPAIAWYERPPDGEEGCWRIRFTASVDRGESFLPPVTLSSRGFCPRPESVAGSRRWPAGGDYFGLVGYDDGAFRALWADSRSGTYQLRTATVRIAR